MENELDNLAPTTANTVEAALDKPQNQPQQDVLASLAPPAQPGIAAPTEIQPVKPVSPRNPLSELAPQADGDALKTSLLGSMRGGNAAGDVSKSSAIATLVKQLSQPAAPVAAAPVAPAAPIAPAAETASPQLPKFTVAPSAFGKGDANGYDYGGFRVELPANLDMNNAKAVADAVSLNNQVVDWMNDEED